MKSRKGWTPPARSSGAFKVGAAVSAVALLVTASAAFGAADPLKGGTTTLALKLPKKVKVKAKGGATKSGKTVSLPITGGSLDPTNGLGAVQNGGSILLIRGKSKVKLTKILTTFGPGGSIKATLKGKKAGKSAKSTKLAKLFGGKNDRAGFGGTVTGAKAKLTKKGAKALNNALGGGFKNNQKLGNAGTTTIPKTVTVKSATSSTTEDLTGLGTCFATGTTCNIFAGKLGIDEIGLIPQNGTVITGSAGSPPIVLTFPPQTGGNMAPDCSLGILTGSPGALTLSRGGQSITQANPNDDFGGKVVTFDVTTTALGALGRAAATNLIVTPGTCIADPGSRTIRVTATQTVAASAAPIVNQVLGLTGTPCGPSAPAPGDPQNCPFTGGESVGTTEYTINTQ